MCIGLFGTISFLPPVETAQQTIINLKEWGKPSDKRRALINTILAAAAVLNLTSSFLI
jgi:hypothetical protein